uniref:Thioredoxin-related transmembrane protein 2 homolog (inferred by orthology to a C. elegans protein) n=1 Tax=Strongyloides venezuelensis TaxID=75913 RepID=A0A0K0F6H0_STRVS
MVPFVGDLMYDSNHRYLDTREHEIVVFLAVVILWRGKKATNWLHYIQTVFNFSKTANVFLFLRADLLYGIIYVILITIVTVVFPQPAYQESDNVIYFRSEDLHKKIKDDTNTVWVVEFYTTWSPECRHVTPVFSKLSERFTLPNLKFAKLDVGTYPKEAERFRINTHPSSKQLPTISIFKGGVEIARRPTIQNKRAVPFIFNEENLILELDLLNTYNECKQPSKKVKTH